MRTCLELAMPSFRKAPHCHFPGSSDTRAGAVAQTHQLGVRCRLTGRQRTAGPLPRCECRSGDLLLPQAMLSPGLLPGSPGSASGKEPVCQCGRYKKRGFNPWIRKIPWRRKWQPTPVFLPGKVLGQRSLAGYSPQGRKESDTTEVT